MSCNGGFEVKKLWNGSYDGHPNSTFWDKLDAMIWVKLRFQFIFFIISIILSIVSIIISVKALTQNAKQTETTTTV